MSEASQALEKLSGTSVDEDTIKSACSKCGVDTSREMDCMLLTERAEWWVVADLGGIVDEFVSVVRHLEEKGTL